MKSFLKILLGISFMHSVCADNQLGLPPLYIPADNLQTPEKIQLGRQLFNDKRFSADQTISCASCHRDSKAFTDGLPTALGIYNQSGNRNTPTLINVALFSSFFLDGRANSLEQQALGPMLNPIEHGLQSRDDIVSIVKHDENYSQQIQRIFGITEAEIDAEHVAKALASFERTLISGNSRFDQYYFGRDHNKLSESEARGLRIFRRKGNCSNCHEISWNNALFSDNRYYNIGIGFERIEPILDNLLTAIKQSDNVSEMELTETQKSELGRFNVTGEIADIGKFKTPTLRNIAQTAPYMHDGSMETLSEVIDYYDRGGRHNPFKDPAIFALHLTEQEKKDLEAFLTTLDSWDIQETVER